MAAAAGGGGEHGDRGSRMGGVHLPRIGTRMTTASGDGLYDDDDDDDEDDDDEEDENDDDVE